MGQNAKPAGHHLAPAGDLTTGTSADSLYMLSIDAYNEALTIYTQKTFPSIGPGCNTTWVLY